MKKISLKKKMSTIAYANISDELLAMLRSEPKHVSDADIVYLAKLAWKNLAASTEEKLLVASKAEQVEIEIASDKAARLNKTFRDTVERIYCRLPQRSKLAKILLTIYPIHFTNINPRNLP